jgi:hypothetical protein
MKQISSLAHAVNSVSGLDLNFGHGLSLDFNIDNIELVTQAKGNTLLFVLD